MKNFEYRKVSTLEEAFYLLAKHQERASILAGGTGLLVKMRHKILAPELLIDLKGIPGLDEIRFDSAYGLRLGALTTIRALEASPLVKEKFGIIAQSASFLGSYQIRTRATLGGNLANASPAADMIPGLISLAAKAKIDSRNGERLIPLEEFFAGPGKTRLQRGEILTEIQIPTPPAATGFHYVKHTIRKAMDLAVVGVAVALSIIPGKDLCSEAKIALGAVSPIPMRASKAEDFLRGQKVDEILISRAAFLAAEEAQPVSDVRASGEYRKEMIRVLTQRALHQAWKTLGGGGTIR